MRILVVEDNIQIAMNIVEYLEADGHAVDHAADGVTALRMLSGEQHGVVILDIALPRMDGLEVCRRIREERGRSLGVIMLTARGTIEDKLVGFDAGADDYIVKPFDLSELEARVRAVAARPGSAAAGAETTLRYHTLSMDVSKWVAECNGRPIQLTRIGMRILEALLRHAPEAIATAELRRAIWGQFPPTDNVLRTHIAAVRRAIDEPGAESVIENIHGVGYRLRKTCV